jgi:4-hydroxy-3-polyprenylbenzoate decarboxylase
MRLVIGMTGATGAILGIRVLEALRELDVETHLVLSHWARATIELETGWSVSEVRALATHVHAANDQAAPISSGSFRADGMIVVPASMKTVAAIRTGYGEGLIARAADVTIKERRKLVLVPRETPLSEIHLDNLLALARMGVRIMPPMPAFYHRPTSIADLVDQTVARILDQVGLDLPGALRWEGARALREEIHASAL